ncbi:hypothetical protein B0H12DRAFT_421242 [Mycena haematopus]|nr:hypothetical protein B0H12DRAFT_421242 [Mycena haematopus]
MNPRDRPWALLSLSADEPECTVAPEAKLTSLALRRTLVDWARRGAYRLRSPSRLDTKRIPPVQFILWLMVGTGRRLTTTSESAIFTSKFTSHDNWSRDGGGDIARRVTR